MTRTIGRLVLLSLVLGANLNLLAQSASGVRVKTVVTFDASLLKYLAIANAELIKKGIDVTRHQLTIIESDKNISILFEDPHSNKGQRGSFVDLLGYEINIEKATLRIVGSNYIRC